MIALSKADAVSSRVTRTITPHVPHGCGLKCVCRDRQQVKLADVRRWRGRGVEAAVGRWREQGSRACLQERKAQGCERSDTVRPADAHVHQEFTRDSSRQASVKSILTCCRQRLRIATLVLVHATAYPTTPGFPVKLSKDILGFLVHVSAWLYPTSIPATVSDASITSRV